MHFVFGYAGIPSDAYDYIYRMRNSLTGGNTEFEGIPLGPRGSAFQTRHANALLGRFKDHAAKNRGNAVANSGFAVIYVRSDAVSSAEFEVAFFPSILVFSVEWQMTGATPEERGKSSKDLFRLLLEATIRARAALEALHKELIERANRTPLLLPLHNFRSKSLRGWMYALQTTLSEQTNYVNAAAAIGSAVKALEADYPPKKVEDPKRKRPCFLDDQEIEFHAPGKALHGLPHDSDDHPVRCILGGHRRLGAPFHAAFHYDCVKGQRGNIKGLFFSCHAHEARPMEGNPHLNIAPNDFVRI
jgi:hypothetical protein